MANEIKMVIKVGQNDYDNYAKVYRAEIQYISKE